MKKRGKSPILIGAVLLVFLMLIGSVCSVSAEEKSPEDIIRELEIKFTESKEKMEALLAFMPNVFRDIEWGTPAEECQGMTLLMSSDKDETYEREGETLTLGDAHIKRKVYRFYDNQLMGVTITAEGEENFEALKKLAFGEFGEEESIQFDESLNEWFWVELLHGTALRLLTYNESQQAATLYLLSWVVYSQRQKEQIQPGQLTSTPEVPKRPQWSTVISWQGSGIKTTEPFRIDGEMWRIEWQNLGDILQVYVHRLNGDLVVLPVNTLNKGEDVSYVYETGEFYLTINALGHWKISIYQKTY